MFLVQHVNIVGRVSGKQRHFSPHILIVLYSLFSSLHLQLAKPKGKGHTCTMQNWTYKRTTSSWKSICWIGPPPVMSQRAVWTWTCEVGNCCHDAGEDRGRKGWIWLDGTRIPLVWLVQPETKRKIQPSMIFYAFDVFYPSVPLDTRKGSEDPSRQGPVPWHLWSSCADVAQCCRSSRCNVDVLLPKWGDNRGPVRLVWIAFVLDAWRGHVHRCAQMCRYCKVVAGACIPWNSSYAMCLWWSSKYI